MTPELFGALLSFSLTFALVWLAVVYARRKGIIDVPNERSSHVIPTPRGGGIGLVSVVGSVAAFVIGKRGREPLALWLFLGVALGLLIVIGWLDDSKSRPVKGRLLVHLFCGAGVALIINRIAPLPEPLNILWLTWWIFWTVGSINVVNFMDGIDGMIASQGLVYGLFLFFLLPETGAGSLFGLILGAGCAGFLLWNWAPARIFMGDAGSGPLGLFFVIGGALGLYGGRTAVVFLPLLPLYFDALITLAKRYRRGESLLQAHRTHLYQRIANGGLGHARVTIGYAAAAAVGAVIGFLVNESTPLVVALAIVAYGLAVVVSWMLLDRRWRAADVS